MTLPVKVDPTDRYGTGPTDLTAATGVRQAHGMSSPVGICDGEPTNIISAPLWTARSSIWVTNILKVRAVNQSKDNIYVSEVTFNGEKLTEPYITHALLDAGGELVFTMSPTPAENGGF